MMENRIIVCDEVRNLRDFGGYETIFGGTVAPARLFRSGHWADAKAQAFDLARKLQIDVFVDLRRPAERSSQPNRLPQDMNILQLFNGGGDLSDPPHVQFLRSGDLSQQSVRTYMQSAYQRIPTESHHLELFRQALLALGDGKNILVHCAAGKDRTGILAALILLLVGVPESVVMEDYLLTNQAVDIEGLLPGITRQIEQRLDVKIPDGALFPMLGVEADFLHEAMKVIGDPEAFARQTLDLSHGDLDRLRTSLHG